MDIVTGTLKPRSPDSKFGFLTADDGSGEVYLNLPELTEKTFGDLYGCMLVVNAEHGEKGRYATELLEIRGASSAIPDQKARKSSDIGSRRRSTFEIQPGQYLSKFANINLHDHTHIITQDDGNQIEKKYKSCLPELHAILLKGEEWDFDSEKSENNFRILENYLKYMYYRIFKEEKITASKDKMIAIFDTGLVDNLFEPIYAVFARNTKEGSSRPYRFEGWCRAGRGPLGKKILEPFSRLPDRAEFFSDINDVILPRDIEVVEQWEHIIDDGVRRGRYPAKFLRKYLPDNFEMDLGLINDSETDAQARARHLNEIMDAIEDSPNYLEFKHKIESCIKTALKRVEWNYKTAIPIYHPRRNNMSIALPLALFDSETADLALILEKKNVRTYYASTVLTLDQAYLSARLVCRPLSDWLTTNIGVVGLGIDD